MRRLVVAWSSMVVIAATVAFPGCSGRRGALNTGGDFVVLRTEPTNGAALFLNEPIAIDFSQPVDLDSANLATMSFTALDSLGTATEEVVAGQFRIDTRADGQGRRLLFEPRLPSNNDYSNGGFRAGRSYLVRLVGGEQRNGTVLRDRRGKGLAVPSTFQFSTREGTQPAQLFRNPKPGGPVRTQLEISPASDLDQVPLGLFGTPALEVRLHFDQALNPHDANVPVNFDSNPLVRSIADRGRVFLEYDDPERNPPTGDLTWIPADVELEQNGLAGAVLVLRPVGVLPNNATIRVIVENTLEDIAGESNVADLGHNRVFGQFRTQSAYTQQWNGIADDFDDAGAIDFGAVFPQAQAEVGPGFLRAGFAFEGRSTAADYEPTANEIVLNTSFTQVVPKVGLPFSVSGGEFQFRHVTIPQGVTVLGQGPNPMVWLCSGDFTVAGRLSVRGGNGARVDSLNSANVAKAGGIGACGGGNGGDGTPSATLTDLRGATGRGPMQAGGMGGGGGFLACATGCYQAALAINSGGGSGGGGGTLATQGDPNYRGLPPTAATLPNTPAPPTNTAFQQRFGFGGAGCGGASGTRVQYLQGGEPAPAVFVDARADNNFWGSGVRLGTNGLRITGELAVAVGGGGGGGGGDRSTTFTCLANSPNPANDNSGGGGGGGGGVLIVKALGTITIEATGKIIADGGHGGGGEQVGSCGQGGGGGGGAGGMVVLMSAKSIRIVAHGSSAANRFVYGAAPGSPFGGNDYDFAISADGGVCTTGAFAGTSVIGKYPDNGVLPLPGTAYDQNPLGGFGGMGIVQLMVPPGISPVSSNDDGTNTKLDDNIHFHLGSATSPAVMGAGKQQLLAWRGFQDDAGRFVDDAGVEIVIGNNEGDIRPSPALLPVPFSAQSRIRSKWIDTGQSQRRPLTTAAGPRGVLLQNGAVVGPKFEFAGLNNAATARGYVAYTPTEQGAVRIDYPLAVPAVAIVSTDNGATYLGQRAYRLTLEQPVSGEADRYVQYEAELLATDGAMLTSLRILTHTDRELMLDATTDSLPDEASSVRVRAKFFRIVTNTNEGLGPTFLPIGASEPRPIANLRMGFAFHQDPAAGPAGRFPNDPQEFVHDLEDPAFLAWIESNGAPRYVQWDVLFDLAHSARPLAPDVPRPELHFLRLPFRF